MTVESIIESILWPRRQVKEGYLATSVTTKDDEFYQGYKLRESKTELVLREAATGNELAGIDKEVFLNLFANKVTLSKAIFLPAGTPADVVKTYADTFKKIYADPEAKKALEAKVGAMNPNFGDDTNNAVRKGLKMDDASRAWLDQFVKRKFNVNL